MRVRYGALWPTMAPSTFTPQRLAKDLGLPAPTAEQAAVIGAPAAPLLVVAGAGSGKTETMAARVVYLVANGVVRPEQVLGLTFTRKAAGELAQRVRTRLHALAARHPQLADVLAGEPTVATYHAYAGRVLAEHGLRGGYEADVRLLTEAARWQLADAVVRAYDGDMSQVANGVGWVTEAVLALAADLSEHLREPAEVADWTERLITDIAAIPPVARQPGPYADTHKVIAVQEARRQLLPLVEQYVARKQAADAIDFGDQLARAARLARDHPEVGAAERDRYRMVLLDEYQDTSHAQVVLLRALYGGGHPVTAVGDPCQSIYGWRGASAGTLDRFPLDFPAPDRRPAARTELTVSWRNRPEILTVANHLSAPLRETGHEVAALRAGGSHPAPHTPAVRCALLETQADEARWIAERIVAAWQSAVGAGPGTPPTSIPPDRRPTTAVLVRVRSHLPVLERALRAHGLPVEVVGLGGLLDTPEVRDVVSTLHVLADPTAGASLLRLLVGPRWRIGPRDVVALYSRARALAADGAEPVLAEALDNLGRPDHYSAEGARRFAAMRDELRALRGRLDQPLPELVADVERTIGLDVEVAARPGDAALARGHLDAFADVAARYAAEAPAPSLAAFLAYLRAAEDTERGLEPGAVEVVEGAVQLLTVHAAKGLEWDVVAVAGLTGKQFPASGKRVDAWLHGVGVLPFPLRGDAAGLPPFDLSTARDQRAVRDAISDFDAAWRAHQEREERRLAYVATTRPRRLLLCGGYWWGATQSRPLGPSSFLEEIRQVCHDGAGAVDTWTDPPLDTATNPLTATPAQAVWPVDPLAGRRPAVSDAATLVHTALARLRTPPADTDESDGEERSSPEGERWAMEVDLLLAERDREAPDTAEVALPPAVSVSQLVALRRDPARLADRLRRPMPERPAPQSRRGTAFHRWLEDRYRTQHLFDLDDLPGAADPEVAGDAEADALRAAFEASQWADRTPVAVEVAFTTVVGGVVVRGRIDAVFTTPDGGYEVVDWKTGRPATGRELAAAAVQLAIYRLAWAELAGVDLADVGAAFHYVRDDVTIRPADLLDHAGVTALVTSVPVTSAPDGAQTPATPRPTT